MCVRAIWDYATIQRQSLVGLPPGAFGCVASFFVMQISDAPNRRYKYRMQLCDASCYGMHLVSNDDDRSDGLSLYFPPFPHFVL